MHGVQKLGQLVEPLPALPRVAGTVCYHLSQLLDVICPPFFKRSLAFEAILWNCGEGIQTCKFSKWKSALASSWLNGIGYFEVTRSHFETDTASCLLHWWMCVCVQLCLTLCDPTDCSLPGPCSFVHGIFPARILEWAANSFSGESSWPRDWTCVSCISCIAGEFFTTEPLGNPLWVNMAAAAAAAAAKLLQSCPTLCNPRDSSPPGFPVPGILQARTLEWVAISFSNAGKWKMKVKSLSCVRLRANPWTAAYQAPPSMGFARQEYWSGVPLPSPNMAVT